MGTSCYLKMLERATLIMLRFPSCEHNHSRALPEPSPFLGPARRRGEGAGAGDPGVRGLGEFLIGYAPRKSRALMVVLAVEEVTRLLAQQRGVHWLMTYLQTPIPLRFFEVPDGE